MRYSLSVFLIAIIPALTNQLLDDPSCSVVPVTVEGGVSGNRSCTHFPSPIPVGGVMERVPASAEDPLAPADPEKARFLAEFPGYNAAIEPLAARELSRLGGEHYLDYTGSGVYQTSQLMEVYSDLSQNAFGNAHSKNPSASRTDERTEEARRLVLEFFSAPEEEYEVVFTSGATQALKMVGEYFPWQADSSFLYLRSNHNSVLGIREYAAEKGASFHAVTEEEVEASIKEAEMEASTERGGGDGQQMPVDQTPKRELKEKKMPGSDDGFAPIPCLFAFPAKDNFSGRYYNLDWLRRLRETGGFGGTLHDGAAPACRRIWTLVDAAAFAPSKRLDLSRYPADFVAISFYKMFGYPTGLGALILRRDTDALLRKTYWGGGAVVSACCDVRWCKPKEVGDPHRLEDGTVNFLSISALRAGLSKLEEVGMDNIEAHIASLSRCLASRLQSLTHKNTNSPVVEVYGGEGLPDGLPEGGVVTFNVLTPDSHPVPFDEVADLAGSRGFHIRGGCFCNPGGCQDALDLTSEDIQRAAEGRTSCGGAVKAKSSLEAQWASKFGGSGGAGEGRTGPKRYGAVRASFGYLSTFEDAAAFARFIEEEYAR
uniref:Aminotransferase class V domain-containing protein n=1 Tax=Chromera velia CCMP2878 TaxID=1169474 RepID=A0A0G4HV75_9ALVE|eukprot:Cvel_8771.t1-p1 / transcript=Cvel_8771.t1 / gene=Cvel_8771 / organism=Chromera_velia_CCMP2878 / gene_product=Molybdenum cofactor sulfurase, putative / transcript_product=Molybdenum cofactor sulfurase, putative / location=Cvel_scaffold490:58850-61670(-) / protein_length=598 / sequence_SO=supercontig / SO=protein_coding / is_pseudo=false